MKWSCFFVIFFLVGMTLYAVFFPIFFLLSHQRNCYSFFLFLFFCQICFFSWESFNLWHLLLMIVIYHQTKTLISFWCRQGLNPKSLIQPSKTLPIKLPGTHKTCLISIIVKTWEVCNTQLMTNVTCKMYEYSMNYWVYWSRF